MNEDDEDDIWSTSFSGGATSAGTPSGPATSSPSWVDGGSRRRYVVPWLLLALGVGAVGWLSYRLFGEDDGSSVGTGTAAPSDATSVAGEELDEQQSAAMSSPTPSTEARAASSTTEARVTTTTARSRATSTAASTGTSSATSAPSTTRPTTAASTTTSPAVSPTSRPAGPIATLPDGSPVPVLAIFDVETITLAGAVPSEEAAERLETLAIANSKTPAAVQSFLTIDPAVPVNVGVRVIELNSVRFPENSEEILPAHAAELDRVAAVMTALPHVTVLVIGHADQRGSPEVNFAISEARARAVVTYLVSRGIAPERLSSRAVGEADLLSLNSDEAALALNRRTEFVFYGLIAPVPPA